ncbi:hypothetical protein [Vibrio sp. Y2-5]|uniref:hypothetical protein n=1 Tax=Vibrio sp. Y2-5 TaxID=2743977 RepID=UPI001CB704C7|nr:hypothetical protein [Vibrio sp. Y2-5]
MDRHNNESCEKANLKKALLWLIVVDYFLLTTFLFQLTHLTINSGTSISLLLVIYNVILTGLCFLQTTKYETYIIYPTITATLLSFICFLYFFFLI